jgi:hypothetical protein
LDTTEDLEGDQQNVSIVVIDIVMRPVYDLEKKEYHRHQKRMRLYAILVREIRCDEAIRYQRIGGGELRFKHGNYQELQALPRKEIVLI